MSALAEQSIGDWLTIRKLNMAQPNIVAVANYLQGVRDEVALIPNMPAAGNIDALQQQFDGLRQEFDDFRRQFNAFQQQANQSRKRANQNHQQLVQILTNVQMSISLCLCSTGRYG